MKTDTSKPKDIDWALNEFRYFDGTYKREAMEYAVQHQEEITPKLLEILEDTLAHPDRYLPPECNHAPGEAHTHDEKENIWSHIYAVTLLSHFREPRAHALIAKLFALPEKICSGLFGDMTTEDLPALLYSTYPGSSEAIKKLVLDKKADDFCRGSAVSALAYCVAGGFLDRRETLDFVAGLFTGKEAGKHSEFWGLAASVIADLYPSEHMTVIRKAFDQGLINEGMINLECFEDEIRNSSPKISLEAIKSEVSRRLPTDVHKRLSKWAVFRNDERNSRRSYRDDFVEMPFVREGGKIGRNDPCPCGSGKKSKKCCHK